MDVSFKLVTSNKIHSWFTNQVYQFGYLITIEIKLKILW